MSSSDESDHGNEHSPECSGFEWTSVDCMPRCHYDLPPPEAWFNIYDRNWGRIERSESLFLNITGANMSSHRVDFLEAKTLGPFGERKLYKPSNDRMRLVIIRAIGHPLNVHWAFVPKPKSFIEVAVCVRSGVVCLFARACVSFVGLVWVGLFVCFLMV